MVRTPETAAANPRFRLAHCVLLVWEGYGDMSHIGGAIRFESIPQRLKPFFLAGFDGGAEAPPLQKGHPRNSLPGDKGPLWEPGKEAADLSPQGLARPSPKYTSGGHVLRLVGVVLTGGTE
jgi:hypothetical protein